jgi:hypothetical protein
MWLELKTDNLTAFVCRFSWDLGASTSWNPQGLSRLVMGLHYLYLASKLVKIRIISD